MTDDLSRVYVVRRGDGLIKIGYASPFLRRLDQLERQFGDLEVLGLIPAGRTEERWLHRKYDSARTGKTEWFDSADLATAAINGTLLDRPGGLCKFGSTGAPTYRGAKTGPPKAALGNGRVGGPVSTRSVSARRGAA